MKLLAIETATDACSAALAVDGEIYTDFQIAPRQHTQLILKQVEKVLSEGSLTLQDLDAIAFGRGPGAFTGLRIAAGVTQGLALAADIPVIAISTLASMAQYAYQAHQITESYVALDARMEQVYWGHYQIKQDQAELFGEESVINPSDINVTASKSVITGIGSGWQAYQSILEDSTKGITNSTYQGIYPSAEMIAQLAIRQPQEHLAPEAVQPVYLRNKVAQTLSERSQ